MLAGRYEYLKTNTHWFALKYHWGWEEVYKMPLSMREEYFQILKEQVEAENQEYESY